MNVDLQAWFAEALKVLDEPRGLRDSARKPAAQVAPPVPPQQPAAPREVGSSRIPAGALDGFSERQWASIRAGAEVFVRQWGDVAKFLGWTEDELFGLDAKAPAVRTDKRGLAFLLHAGDEVVALDEDRAIIRTAGGARQTFYRTKRAPSVPKPG